MADIIPLPPHATGDDAAPLEPMALLNLIARRAMAAGADPSAPVSADHELLMLCDGIAMLKRQNDEALADVRAASYGPESREAHDDYRRRQRALRSPLLRLSRMRAHLLASSPRQLQCGRWGLPLPVWANPSRTM